MKTTPRHLACAFALGLLILAPPGSAGAETSTGRYEAQLASYRLTLDKVRHWAVAAYQVRMSDRAACSGEAVRYQTADDLQSLASRIRARPRLMKCYADQGLSAEDAAAIDALMTGRMLELADPGRFHDTLILSPDQSAFVELHKVELARINPFKRPV